MLRGAPFLFRLQSMPVLETEGLWPAQIKAIRNPELRQLTLDIKANNELTIDHASQDQAIEAGFIRAARDRRILTDLVSLVRFAIHQDNELIPFPERVNANFNAWLATQRALPPLPQGEGWGEGETVAHPTRFTPEQLKWLEMIRDHIAANLGIEPDDFEYAPFAQEGGLGKVYQLFGDELNMLIEQLNESLAA